MLVCLGVWLVDWVENERMVQDRLIVLQMTNMMPTNKCSRYRCQHQLVRAQEMEAEGPLPDCSDSDEDDDGEEMAMGGQTAAALRLKGGFKG